MAKRKKKRRKSGPPGKLRSSRQRARFLVVLRGCGGLRRAACRQFGISHQTLRNEEQRDASFREQTDPGVIHAECFEDLEAEAYHRAMHGSDTLLKLLLAVGNPKKYAQRHLLEHQGNIEVDHEVRITVVEDDHWYRNDAHRQAAAGLAAPSADSAIEGTVQSGDLRPPVGKNGDRPDGHG